MFLNEADYLVGYEHIHGKIPGMSLSRARRRRRRQGGCAAMRLPF